MASVSAAFFTIHGWFKNSRCEMRSSGLLCNMLPHQDRFQRNQAVLGIVQVDPRDEVVRLLSALRLELGAPEQKFMRENAERLHADLVVVSAAFDHLRGN